MKIKQIIMTSLLSCITAMTFIACSDEGGNNKTKFPTPSPKEQWGATLKGDGEVLGAYPDLYSNYWEYTYQADQNSDKILCLKGEYPHCRYFSISLYNDETGDVFAGIDDQDISADKGSTNPFTKTTSGKNYFTIYVVPNGTSQSVIDKLGSKNVVKVKEGVNKVAIALRHYLGTTADGSQKDEYAGLELPAITALDMNLHETSVPEHVASNVYKVTSKVFTQKSDENKEMPFFLAPIGRYYPNNSTSYLYGRTHLREDYVLTFSFIPAPVPTKPEEYKNAVTRYWSICLGSASDTRSYLSVHDKKARYADGKKATFVVCLKKNPKLSDIQSKVNEMNANGEYVNLFIWDSEKKNIDGNPIGEIVAVMYRNILPDKKWEHSIANMTPTAYKDKDGEPIDHVTNPDKQLAHKALGDYGPLGVKVSNEDFLQ